jgi:leucyl-tRNA synthetase
MSETPDHAHPAINSFTPDAGVDHPYRYTARLADHIERTWQDRWDAAHRYTVKNPGEPGFDASKPKYYVLDMFPYPSGAGLHVGHPEGYTATDILSRYKRMCGFNVLHPMGWDAFGLPAEQYAVQTGIHPSLTTRKSIETFRRQLKRFGFCYDWSREFGTIDEDYYRWTQWIFLKLYHAWFDPKADNARGRARHIDDLAKEAAAGTIATPKPWAAMSPAERDTFIDSHRLAYLNEQVVNWCPKLGTVLANDEVIDGKSERGGYPVLRKPLKQWVFRITAYADRLLRQIDGLEWPESTKIMQREWIGKSEGAEIDFAITEAGQPDGGPALRAATNNGNSSVRTNLRVFTTRPDTLFGATYMVVAPEHELCERILSGEVSAAPADVAALKDYCAWARNRSDIERQENKEKTGCFTGVHALNPATGEKIPVWAADYVLMGYGTGAIMAVPAHDQRDYEFAEKFNLPIRDVLYTRQQLAIQYYTRNAPTEEASSDKWIDTLADLLGFVTSMSTPPEQFHAALNTIRTRRRSAPRPGDAPPADSSPNLNETADVPGAVGQRRGATKITWLEFIESLKVPSFDALKQIFDDAGYAKRSGQTNDGGGFAANSANAEVSLNGLPTADAKHRVIDWLASSSRGCGKTNYKLRDWVFSRQRYWGEPFPIVYDAAGKAYPVMESALPVKLPPLADYAPIESDDPKPLLAKATDWVHTTAGHAGVDPALLPPATPVTRETNTMPGSAGSSWYAIRYCDPRNQERFVGKDAESYWMGGTLPNGQAAKSPQTRAATPAGGVDFYLGGSEHAVGHLLYSRFWQNVLYDLNEVSTPEPFHKLFHQGLITSFSYQRADKTLVPTDEVKELAEGGFIEISTGKPVTQTIAKMSKSLKNVVNPDDVIAEFGADTFRLYEMFMGPLEASKPWNPRDISGCFRFLQRVWRNLIDEQTGKSKVTDAPPAAGPAAGPEFAEALRTLHKTIKGVRHDIETLGFNTAISKLIELNNLLAKLPGIPMEIAKPFILMLSPLTPHLAEELWSRVVGDGRTVVDMPFPESNATLAADDIIEMPVQIAGKVRARLAVPPDADAKAIEALVLADPKVQEFIAGKPIKKLIVVPGRMVNIVV